MGVTEREKKVSSHIEETDSLIFTKNTQEIYL